MRAMVTSDTTLRKPFTPLYPRMRNFFTREPGWVLRLCSGSRWVDCLCKQI